MPRVQQSTLTWARMRTWEAAADKEDQPGPYICRYVLCLHTTDSKSGMVKAVTRGASCVGE